MAKIVGLVGTGSGKVGNFVLAKGEDGTTIARAYQPQVNNPKSAKQSMQRVKINLVGQLSGMLDAVALRPMSMGSTRKNRSAFLREALRIVTVTQADGVYRAKFQPGELVLSHGTAPLVSTPGTVAVTINRITLPVTVPSSVGANKYGERLVAIIYKDESSTIPMGAYYSDTLYTASGSVDEVISLPWNLDPANVITLYRVPFVVNESGASLVSSRIYASAGEVVAALTRNSTSAVDWGDTVYAGISNFSRALKSSK